MVDNTSLLVPFLWERSLFVVTKESNKRNVTNDNFFYFYISQRKKDGHEENRIVREYYISSVEEFQRKYSSMKSLCQALQGRIYVNPNMRSFRKVAFETNKLMAEYLCSGQFDHVQSAFSKSVGRNNSEPKNGTCWVLDVDFDEYDNIVKRHSGFEGKTQKEIEEEMVKELTLLECVIALIIPTKNGKHYLVSPFNVAKWEKLPFQYGIQKNSPTLLFA